MLVISTVRCYNLYIRVPSPSLIITSARMDGGGTQHLHNQYLQQMNADPSILKLRCKCGLFLVISRAFFPETTAVDQEWSTRCESFDSAANEGLVLYPRLQ